MSINFRNFRINNLDPCLSVEETFHLFGAWAGIHDFQFDSRYELASHTETGVIAAQWNLGPIVATLPPSFEINYHKVDLRQGLYFYDPTSGLFWMIATDATGQPSILRGNDLAALAIPRTSPAEADVRIVFQQQRYDDSQDSIWRSVTVYMNDAWVISFAELFPIAAASVQVGFMAYGTDAITYTDIRVPELCEIAEFGTLDPGESAMSGLQRTTDGRYLKFFVRYDGSFRAWKKKIRPVAMTIDTEIDNIKRTYDMGELITHARMMGAYIWAEAADNDKIRDYGHRFEEVDNQMLLTEQECAEEAVNELKRSEENSFGVSAVARHIPLLEPEDRVTIDGEDWVVNDYDSEGGYGDMQQTTNARRYVWGS